MGATPAALAAVVRLKASAPTGAQRQASIRLHAGKGPSGKMMFPELAEARGGGRGGGRRRLSSTRYAEVEIFGLDEFQRQLRRAPADVRKRVSQGSKQVADHLVRDMRRRARAVPHARQYALVLPSLRAVAGRTPRVRLGGSKAGGSGKGSKAGQFIYGVEFGSLRKRRTYPDRWFAGGGSTRQFPRHRGDKGYVIFPTIQANHEFIKREYTKQIEKALRRI